MNKQENKLALSVLTTLISGIALIYTLIMYHNIIFAVMGMSLIFLICAYILTQNIIAFSIARNKTMNSQLRDYINDISEQLENMSGTQSQLGKATFLYTKQAAQAVATLENNYIESQEALYRNLTSISNAQNKATKLMIKYDQSNTTKVISTIKELRNQLSDTMIQGFDQIQPNNTEVIEALEDIVNYLKNQPAVPDQTLSIQLNNVAHELQNISNSMQHFQMPVQSVAQTVSAPAASPVADAIPTDATPKEEPAPIQETVATSTNNNDLLTNDDIASLFAALEEPKDETPASDPNKQLSADEIAALFAAAEPTPKKEPVSEAVAEAVEEEKPFTPTFTVVGKSNEYVEEKNVTTIGDITDDPNKQLSADEIAALFAAADPSPKKEEKPEPVVTPINEDPNKQLSADEIAALFAAAEPTPAKSISDEEKAMDDAITKAESVSVSPISEDPNKQLSADEIAALFASLG